MIKPFLLNNLLVPLRQISPSMLFASAALHSLLLAVPVPSNSNNELEKGSNSPDEDTTEVSAEKDVCDDEDASLNDGIGEDSLGEDASLSEGAGDDSLGEDASLSEGVGDDSLGEDSSLSEGVGDDSLGEDASLSEGVGDDSLGEDASLSEGVGDDSLGEDASLSEGVGDDSLGEDASLSEGVGDDSLGEEIEEGENQTSASNKELCDDGSLPKGKAIKVPGDGSIPLTGLDTEDGSGIEEDSTDGDSLGEDVSLSEGTGEDSLGEDVSITDGAGEETLGDLASIGADEGDSALDTGVGEESFDEGDSTPDAGAGEESFDEGDSTPDAGAGEESFNEGDSTPDAGAGEEPLDEGDSNPGAEVEEKPLDEGDSTPDTGAGEEPLDEGDSAEKEIESNPDNQPQQRPVDPFADFPKYTGVKPYVCGTQMARIHRRTRRTSDSLNDVQAYFDKQLASTDFQVEKLADKPDTKVYQISKGNLTQYLQLFAVKEQGTMILLSSQRVDCYRLSNQDQQEKPKTEEQAFDAMFQSLYAQFGWTEDKDFAVTSEIEKIFGKDTNKTPDELALLVKSKLESEGFETSQVNQESSEILYEVKKGEFSKYISFVPTKEGKGAIILALKNYP